MNPRASRRHQVTQRDSPQAVFPDVDIGVGKQISPLAADYIESPFSILRTTSGRWRTRKAEWKEILGVRLEGREDGLTFTTSFGHDLPRTSTFDPVLAELIVSWFSPPAGMVYNPLAGDVEPGFVASSLGRRYVGLELRSEQVEANARAVTSDLASYHVGDAQRGTDALADESADLLFACPPYWKLERYSDDPADLSNMSWLDFKAAHEKIIEMGLNKLAQDRFAVWVVGYVIDDKRLVRLADHTVAAFEENGATLHNSIVLATATVTAGIRAGVAFEKTRRVIRVHEEVLVFVKGDASRAAAACIGGTT